MSIFSYANDPISLIINIFIKLIIIFCVLPIHEYAHGLAAKKMGDNTASAYGRLTVNPLAHIDPLGAIMIFLVGFGWAKPVPINPRNFKDYKKGVAITAFAGPFANLICAAVGILLNKLINNGFVILVNSNPESAFALAETLSYIVLALNLFSQINISLAVFNLIPIPPLDGSKILSCFASYKVNNFMSRNQTYIYYGFILLLVIGVLDGPLSWLINIFYSGIELLFFWVDLIFKLII